MKHVHKEDSCPCSSKHCVHEHGDHSHEEHCHDDGSDECDCSCGHEHGNAPTEKRDLILLAASIVLLIISLFFERNSRFALIFQISATLCAGYDMLLLGIKGLFRLSLDEMTLMTIAVVAAFAIGEGFEGVLVTVLFKIGAFFEGKAIQNSRKRIDALVTIVPENANLVLADGSAKETSAKNIAIGDIILLKVGDRVPLDCCILEGSSDMDTSAITGESLPVRTETGEHLLSGMINLSGILKCRVEKNYENSTANKIAELVKDATREKGNTERFITRFSKIYTPVVVVMAVLIATIPPLIGGSFTVWLHKSLTFLVASCPCALVISVPLTFYSVIGTVSRMGALIKGSKHVEILAKAQNFVFDKTGTLTTGKVTVLSVDTLSELSKDHILRLSAICETVSSHPIAKAVTEKMQGFLPSPDSAEEIAGKGVKAVIDGKSYLCGSYKLMNDCEIDLSNVPVANLYLSDGSKILGYIRIGDTLKPEAEKSLASLKSLGSQQNIMLTGDRREQAEMTAKFLAIDEIRSDLLPQQKVEELFKIKASGTTVFVGDGINDGPVLAAADLGIAMGMGSDLATQTADIVLLSNNLCSIPSAVKICRQGMSIVQGNIAFILLVKALVLLLSGIFGVPMFVAIFADVGVTLLTILNSLRILTVKTGV